jgi:phosphate starvation-inducible protein PhoH and related proteins
LETGYTIVVGSHEQLSALCGVNDGNLRAIEDYLGAPVVSRGNELTVASSDADICRKFQNLIDHMLADNGVAECSFEMVQAFIASMEGDKPFFSDSFIQIPHGIKRIYPKTVRQAELITRLQQHEIVFALGPAGTGKTFIAVAEALKLLLSRRVRKIVLTRPVVEAGESLGFLPGDLEQKIDPYVRPLYDAMEALLPPEILRKIEDSRMIEVAPLAYMRGRSLDHAVLLLDEAQNTTREQMKMFLTRLGEESRAIVTGDPSQVDLPSRIESGLSHATSILQNVPEVAIVSLETRDVVRNPLVKKIVQAYEQETL